MNGTQKATRIVDLAAKLFKTNPNATAYKVLENAMLAYQAICHIPAPTSPLFETRYADAKKLLNSASDSLANLLDARGLFRGEGRYTGAGLSRKQGHLWLHVDPMD